MALPGTPGQRISDLCNGNHISQKQLAEKIGVSASQLEITVHNDHRIPRSQLQACKNSSFLSEIPGKLQIGRASCRERV